MMSLSLCPRLEGRYLVCGADQGAVWYIELKKGRGVVKESRCVDRKCLLRGRGFCKDVEELAPVEVEEGWIRTGMYCLSSMGLFS